MSTYLSSAMSILFRNAASSITREELERIANLPTMARLEALRLSQVCEGIACLVAEDAKRELQEGIFQEGQSVFDLLCSVAHGLDTISAMIDVGMQANAHLNEMRSQPGRALEARCGCTQEAAHVRR